MENYTYPESGDSSPRSREVEFENPPSSSWEDSSQQPPPLSKVKFICSYGGKIHPRPHDNQLAYVGGETKILSLDRSVTFGALLPKLAALCDDENAAFKYQLPGEDLDALISVTNDDDLEHMMHEYERLVRSSNKPARLRIFVFPVHNRSLGGSSTRSFGSEKERFVDAFNSAPVVSAPEVAPEEVSPPPPSSVDLLFGLERVNVNPPPPSRVEIEESVDGQNVDQRLIALDPIQKHIQDLQMLRLEEQQQQRDDYRRKSDENPNLAGGAEEYYKPPPEKFLPAQIPTGGVPYHIAAGGGIYPGSAAVPNEHQQQVYMIHAPASGYHAPMARQVNAPPQVPQGYYAVQRILPDLYPEHHRQQQLQQLYNLSQSPAAGSAPPSAARDPATQGYGLVRQPISGVVGGEMSGYQQLLYDGAVGRQVVYGAPQGGVVGASAQYHQAPVMSGGGDVRAGGALSHEGKGVASAATKVATSQSPM